MPIIMTSITWADPRCVQELAAILAPQNPVQGRCGLMSIYFIIQAGTMSPGTFEWYYISVTEHHLLNREGHECEVRGD